MARVGSDDPHEDQQVLNLDRRHVAVAVVVDDERGDFPCHRDDPPTVGELHRGRLGRGVGVDHPVAEQPEPLLVLSGDSRVGDLNGLVPLVLGSLHLVFEFGGLNGRVALDGVDGIGRIDPLGVNEQRAAEGEDRHEHCQAGQFATGNGVEPSTVTELTRPRAPVLDEEPVAGEPVDQPADDKRRHQGHDVDRQAHLEPTPPVEPVHERVDGNGEGTAGESRHAVPPDT